MTKMIAPCQDVGGRTTCKLHQPTAGRWPLPMTPSPHCTEWADSILCLQIFKREWQPIFLDLVFHGATKSSPSVVVKPAVADSKSMWIFCKQNFFDMRSLSKNESLSPSNAQKRERCQEPYSQTIITLNVLLLQEWVQLWLTTYFDIFNCFWI